MRPGSTRTGTADAVLRELKARRQDHDRALRTSYRSGPSREELATITELSPETVRVFASTKH